MESWSDKLRAYGCSTDNVTKKQLHRSPAADLAMGLWRARGCLCRNVNLATVTLTTGQRFPIGCIPKHKSTIHIVDDRPCGILCYRGSTVELTRRRMEIAC